MPSSTAGSGNPLFRLVLSVGVAEYRLLIRRFDSFGQEGASKC